MPNAYSILVAAHGAVGTVALAAFWSAAALRKGGPAHRRAGQAYLLAMVGIVLTAIPLAGAKFADGKPVIAAFLAYLVVITSTGVWTSWRAIRDRHDVSRYTGGVYRALALLSLASGLAILVFGLHRGMPLLMGFSAIGLFTGVDMLRKARRPERLGARPRWWLVEHYTAMLGNGIATHIAFLSIGLPRLLPQVDGAAAHYLAWFGPLAVALMAKVVVDRRWKPRAAGRGAAVAAAS